MISEVFSSSLSDPLIKSSLFSLSSSGSSFTADTDQDFFRRVKYTVSKQEAKSAYIQSNPFAELDKQLLELQFLHGKETDFRF